MVFIDRIVGMLFVPFMSKHCRRTAWRPGEPRLLVVSSDAGQIATGSNAPRCATVVIARDARCKTLNCAPSNP